MFTGLIEEIGVVRRFQSEGGGGRLTVQATTVLSGTRIGDSISVNGACLTVVALGSDEFTVDCMPETLAHTSLKDARRGAPVNLERAIGLGDRLGGHLVLGHVDAVGEVLLVTRNANAVEIRFSLPDDVAAYVAPKGSVAIDGVSLTVVRVGEAWFEVGVIPHTLEATTLKGAQVGRMVNIEADVLARYVQRAMEWTGARDADRGADRGLTEELLREKGFI